METLTFKDIANLINHSRTAHIDLEPATSGGEEWALYKGLYNVHGKTFPFEVLYFTARATIAGIRDAKRRVFKEKETQVVYPPSIGVKSELSSLYEKQSDKFLTGSEYLASFIRDELQEYANKLIAYKPKFYIDPHIVTPQGARRKLPNPIHNLLTDPDTSASESEGMLGIVLAEPGQGKTFMCEYLVGRLAEFKKGIFPIFISSEQWETMRLEELGSIWKTLVHSFQYAEAPIPWIVGNEDEFLKTTLKAGLFRIVFDGFDEYVLRSQGTVSAIETLRTLSDLVQSTGARIVLTSRTSFWDTEIADLIPEDKEVLKSTYIYNLEPFDINQAKSYFEKRFPQDEDKVKDASAIFNEIRQKSEKFSGRGFVLSLLADLVSGDVRVSGKPEGKNPIVWLMKALCERDKIRHKLPLDADEQILVFQDFVGETCQGEKPSTELLDYSIALVAPRLDEISRKRCIEGMSAHPLINRGGDGVQSWRVTQEQVEVILLAGYLYRCIRDKQGLPTNFNSKANIGYGRLRDISNVIVSMAENKLSGSLSQLQEKIRNILQALLNREGTTGGIETSPLGLLAGNIILKGVDTISPKGESHKERADTLYSLSPSAGLNGIIFGGTIAGIDFRGRSVEKCRFDHVRWINCEFDDTTTFKGVHFSDIEVVNSKGFGSSIFDNVTTNTAANEFIKRMQVVDGGKKYEIADLESDIRCVLDKFVPKGRSGFQTRHESYLGSGTIRVSPHKDIVLDAVKKRLLEKHVISGVSEPGYHVKDDVKDDFLFYTANNVFTGLVKKLFKELEKKIFTK